MTNPGPPLISVIMPVYNAASFLPGAVASVRAQSYAPLEIILIDDGSTDGLNSVLTSLGDEITLLRQPNLGPSAARNAGIRAAAGSLIAFLDADDRWPLDKLKTQSEYLDAHPEVDIVTGHVHYVLLEGATLHEHRFVEQYGDISHVHLGAGLFRREIFNRIGLFDESLRHGEDLDWFFRVRELKASMIILPEVTLNYQRHSGNTTRDLQAGQNAVLTTIQKSLERRRGAGQAQDLRKWTTYIETNTGEARIGEAGPGEARRGEAMRPGEPGTGQAIRQKRQPEGQNA